ncbi:MAG: hypothetical protein PHO54_03965 [Candidatus Peribacteraceae bacterium]|nr:hypothetical protein [Candidatus Peribacteraceae bacterium]
MMLSAVANAELKFRCGNLTIRGTDGPDCVEVSRQQSTISDQVVVTIKGSSAVFPTHQVKNISVRTLGGPDEVKIGNLVWAELKSLTVQTDGDDDPVCLGATNAKAKVYLGDGNDCFLTTGRGSGSLYVGGDGGNDWIDARTWQGKATLNAQRGVDTVFGSLDGAQTKFWLQGDKGNHDVAHGRITDKYCLDKYFDTVEFYGDGDDDDGPVTLPFADEQYDTLGQWWLLRANTVRMERPFCPVVDPLNRVQFEPWLNGVRLGVHLTNSSIRVEVPSLSAFSIDPGLLADIYSAGYTINVVVVVG